ncbi:MAG: YbaN family protein [Defluviitaleaceae bacterium]|nr:YbaN family protein [Defluviitaleaceae bacterium]
MKYVYILAGLVCLSLGAIGTIMPLLPTTPFVILAAMCFGKSSSRLHKWFTCSRLYKNNLESLVKERSMTLPAKLKAILSITLFMGLSLFIMHTLSSPLIPQIILAIVWALHIIYFAFIVKTKIP